VKPIMITLMYLTFGGDIKLDTFEIHSSCSSWFYTNVKVEENKKRKLFSSLEYHVYKDERVIGYICGGDEPR
jgi:hypothetical protein|tara:strand:- start:533 stop:748 length:216 start_codon:yes stop_codon:yes gene_type:complete